MTRNPKPNELPGPIDAMPALTRPLIIDTYLDRAEVIRRISQEAGIRRQVNPNTGNLTHRELAGLYRAVVDDEDRDVATIYQEQPKYRIIVDLGDHFDFRTRDDQDTLIKSQLIHVLVTLATGDAPDTFEVPSDPDLEQPDEYSDLPVLGDA